MDLHRCPCPFWPRQRRARLVGTTLTRRVRCAGPRRAARTVRRGVVRRGAFVVLVVVTASVVWSTPTASAPAPAVGPTTVYLPNVTKMLGGPDGWQTPFIVQNVGAVATAVTMSFYSFEDGSLVRTRSVASLAP